MGTSDDIQKRPPQAAFLELLDISDPNYFGVVVAGVFGAAGLVAAGAADFKPAPLAPVPGLVAALGLDPGGGAATPDCRL